MQRQQTHCAAQFDAQGPEGVPNAGSQVGQHDRGWSVQRYGDLEAKREARERQREMRRMLLAGGGASAQPEPANQWQ